MAGYSCIPTGCVSRFSGAKWWLCVVCSPMHATLRGAANAEVAVAAIVNAATAQNEPTFGARRVTLDAYHLFASV